MLTVFSWFHFLCKQHFREMILSYYRVCGSLCSILVTSKIKNSDWGCNKGLGNSVEGVTLENSYHSGNLDFVENIFNRLNPISFGILYTHSNLLTTRICKINSSHNLVIYNNSVKDFIVSPYCGSIIQLLKRVSHPLWCSNLNPPTFYGFIKEDTIDPTNMFNAAHVV